MLCDIIVDNDNITIQPIKQNKYDNRQKAIEMKESFYAFCFYFQFQFHTRLQNDRFVTYILLRSNCKQ